MKKKQKLVLATAVIGALGSMGCRTLSGLSVQPVQYVDSVIHYPGDGGVVVSTSRQKDKGICVAPPAQAAVTIDLRVRGRGKQDVSLQELTVSRERELEVGLAETLGRLYEQNEQTLFLQHSLYRLCEAYVNGLFDTVPYSMWLAEERIRTERRAAELEAPANAGDTAAKEQRDRLLALAEDLKKAYADAKGREDELLSLAKERTNCAVPTPTKRNPEATTQLEPLECQQYYLRQVSRTSYMQAVGQVLETAKRLSEIDVDRHRALAEVARAEAEKAKAELAKAKADETAKKNAALLDELRTKTLDSVTKALSRCGEKCGEAEKEEAEEENDG